MLDARTDPLPRPAPRPHLRTTGPRTLGLAVGALLLLGPGFFPSVTRAAEPEPIFAAAQCAIRDGRIEKSRVLGFHHPKREFTELPAQGALLIGFDLGVGRFFDIETVYALRPVYRTAWGETTVRDHGLFRDRWMTGKKVVKTKVVRTVSLRARPGYAVGSITLRSGLNINGLSLTYMRINGRTLDPERACTSAWVGDRTGGSEASMSGNGAPVVGLFGSEDTEHTQSLGLLFVKGPAPLPPPDPSRKEKPVTRPAEPPPAEKPVIRPAEPPTEEKRAENPAEPPQVRPAEEPADPPKPEQRPDP